MTTALQIYRPSLWTAALANGCWPGRVTLTAEGLKLVLGVFLVLAGRMTLSGRPIVHVKPPFSKPCRPGCCMSPLASEPRANP
jgi:hypothetical protein